MNSHPDIHRCINPKCSYVGRNMFDLVAHMADDHEVIVLSSALKLESISFVRESAYCLCGQPIDLWDLDAYRYGSYQWHDSRTKNIEEDQALWNDVTQNPYGKGNPYNGVVFHLICHGGPRYHWETLRANFVMDRLSPKK